jgi:hypothetical protein
LISELETVLSNRITDQEAESGSKVAADAAATVTFAVMAVNSGNIPQVSLPLNQIINQDALFRLVAQRNLSNNFIPSLLASQVDLPSKVSEFNSEMFSVIFITLKCI